MTTEVSVATMHVRLALEHALVGVWVPDSSEAYTEFSISVVDGAFQICGKSRFDGESFVISDVTWDGARVSFTSLMPSTGQVVRNEFRPVGDDRCRCVSTFTKTELWRRKLTQAVCRRDESSENVLAGTWVNENGGAEVRSEYGIDVDNHNIKVVGRDRLDGEEYVISDVEWDGKILRFASLIPSTGRIGRHVLLHLQSGLTSYKYSITEIEFWRRTG